MSEKSSRLDEFLENFGKVPDTPPREIIPKRWRMLVFTAMIVVGAVGLSLVVALWLIPALNTQNVSRSTTKSTSAPASVPASSGRTP